jgi:hypothetical protein
MEVLSWITCAKRSLTTLELLHALAVEDEQSKLDEENLSDIGYMVSLCAGLVTVDKESDIIRLVHYTTQEYFIKTRNTWFPDAHCNIAKICVTYLSFDAFETNSHQKQDIRARLRLHPLYSYAALNWGHHARISSIEGEKLILDLLESTAKVCACS